MLASRNAVDDCARCFGGRDTLVDGFVALAARTKLEIKEVSSASVMKTLATAYSAPPDVVRAASSAMNLTGADTGN